MTLVSKYLLRYLDHSNRFDRQTNAVYTITFVIVNGQLCLVALDEIADVKMNYSWIGIVSHRIYLHIKIAPKVTLLRSITSGFTEI